MPQITNNFLKSKMNKDLDNRILPNGEYRDARNLQISRSQGSEVGEFENISGNTKLQYLYTGASFNGAGFLGKIIGQFTNESTSDIYIYSAGWDNANLNQEVTCPRDTIVILDSIISNGSGGSILTFKDAAGNILNPEVLNLQIGMLLWGDSWGPSSLPSGLNGIQKDPTITKVTSTNIEIGQGIDPGTQIQVNDVIYVGFNNTIHRYNILSDELTLLVRGDFLNFSTYSLITGINLIEDLLFWTDDRNQPRKINVNLANPQALPSPIHYVNEDQISVAKYYPYETPLVLEHNIKDATGGAQASAPLKGYVLNIVDTSGIKIGDIASGFPGQNGQELWNVISIDPGVSVTIYDNFKDGNFGANMSPGNWDGSTSKNLTSFKRPSVKNLNDKKQTNGFDTIETSGLGAIAAGTTFKVQYNYLNKIDDQSPQPTPRVGDFITCESGIKISTSAVDGLTINDQVVIQEVTVITPGASGGSIELQLTKGITVTTAGSDVIVSANPNYDSQFTGDPDLIEEKFIRFSYRFKFEDNEYSLAAPYTQICFIPKNAGLFGGGQNETLQDMKSAYDSTILEWFTNNIDTVSLKIPIPEMGIVTSAGAIQGLINDYKVTDIEILYKESDALSVKILENIEINNELLPSFLETIPNTGSISSSEWYYNFDYKSIKSFRTLPTSEQNRVYDNVPIKALSQEITANRVMYGNFLQKHTPPSGIDYEIINEDKSVAYDNYAQYPYHSIKQNRNYQAGFVLSDRYGRASSVVLSSNDDNPDVAGSTIYVPYKTFGELDDPQSDVTTYKWLGDVLKLKVNNGISQTTNNSQTGEPGLYKSWTNKKVDIVGIAVKGTNFAVGDEIGFKYDPANRGQGDFLSIKVLTIDAGGGVEGFSIINYGKDYVDGQVLLYNLGSVAGAGLTIQVFVNPPNVTGWQSYKLVVKQQEQEYYNVYLPGYVSGYPVKGSADYGRIAFSSLFGDNINKVPRDLIEVGPTQTEFSSSVVLFGRVNNPNINNNQKGGAGVEYYENRQYAWNCQYYPGRLKDEAITVGPLGLGGLELANSPFDPASVRGAFTNISPGAIPWGDVTLAAVNVGAVQSFYNVEQNPLGAVIKVGAEDTQPNLTQSGSPQLNTLGAKVTDDGTFPIVTPSIGCMYPFLSVSETEPVESLLEIFYESSTSGNFVDLNTAVVSDYGGVTRTSVTVGSFDEFNTSGTNILTSFNFQDSAGNSLDLNKVPEITQVLDSNGNDVTGIFKLTQSSGTGVAPFINFDLETNDVFWYGSPTATKSNQWFVTFQTEYGVFVDIISNAITVNLTNISPTMGGFTPTLGPDAGVEQVCGKAGGSTGYDSTSVVFGQFTSVTNGSVDVINDTQEICYTLAVLAEPAGSTAIWDIDQTGVITKTSGSVVNGIYNFECTVTDASLSCLASAGSISQACEYELVFGTPPVNQALCFGPTGEMSTLDTSCGPSTGTGQPLEVFFGVNRFTNSGITGAGGSKTHSILSIIDTSLGAVGPKYGLTSNNGLDLRYYNVLEEARYATNAWDCIDPGPPPVTFTPAFTTGALDQGVLAIQGILSKSAFASTDNEYKTNFTILYRATAADAWQLATCLAGSPSQPAGGAVGNFNLLTVLGTGSTTASLTYFFENIGEYAVRNNGVHSIGCTACSTCASFTVNYYDATFGGTISPCTTCSVGPL